MGVSDPLRPELKWKMLLAEFAAGRSLNRFEAERLGDHCLHTTVANLEGRGVRIERKQEVIEGRFGKIHCKRYRLDPESIVRARELLGGAA